jgi:hypothetical protein
MGRGGLYFRATLPGGHGENRRVTPETTPGSFVSDGLEEIESASTLGMIDSSSAALLEEINSKAKKMSIWPFVLLGTATVLVGLIALQAPLWVVVVLSLLGAGVVYFASVQDRLRKTVVLFYQMEPQFEGAYQQIHDVFDQMRACRRIWHVEARGDVKTLYEWKTSGGASSVVRRKSIAFKQGAPPYFKTNVSIPLIPAGRQTIYFFPDRVLVYAPEGVGAVSYDALRVNWGDSRFIEEDGVPSDAKVVDTTWRFVNKSGGPDRRYNNNQQLPAALYGVVEFVSGSGLWERFQLSRTGLGPLLENAVQGLAAALGQGATVENRFLTCPCNNCSGHIEFPADGVGQPIACPHCGLQTVLFCPPIAVV